MPPIKESGADHVAQATGTRTLSLRDIEALDFRPYRRTGTTRVAGPLDESFTLDTRHGLATGQAGDYVALDAEGDPYPIKASVMAATYTQLDDPTQP